MKNIIVDAFVLAYKREKNLTKVISGIKKQTFIRNIYVFHNSPSNKRIDGVINIVSDENFGCFGRHVAALLTDSDYTLFVDDDTELLIDFSDRFLKAIKDSPYSIIGIYGRNLNVALDKEYTRGIPLFFSYFQRYVDIVIGKVHLCSKEQLLKTVSFVKNNQNKMKGLEQGDFIMDDLILNLSSQIHTEVPSVLIKCHYDEIKSLNNDFSQCEKSDHYILRDILLKEFRKKGWKSFLSDYYQQINKKKGLKFLEIEKELVDLKKCIKDNNIVCIEKILSKIEMKYLKVLDLYNIASIYFINNKYEKALEYYKIILSMNINHENINFHGLTYYKMGLIYQKKGNLNTAIRFFKKCLVVMPEHEDTKIKLEKIK